MLLVNSATNDLYKLEPLGVILRCGLKLEGSVANVGMSLFKKNGRSKNKMKNISPANPVGKLDGRKRGFHKRR